MTFYVATAPPGEKCGLVPAALFQRQCIALLAEVQLLQEAHSEQDIFPAEPGVDAGADRAYPEIAEPDFVQHGLPGPDRTVGGLVNQGLAFFKPQPFGYRQRDGDIGGAGVQHEFGRLAVDQAAGDIMSKPVALQLHFRQARGRGGRQHLPVGVVLPIQLAIEKPGQQHQ